MEKKAKNGYRKKNPIYVYLVIGFGNILQTTYLLTTFLTSQKWDVISILAGDVDDFHIPNQTSQGELWKKAYFPVLCADIMKMNI
jgi:hypothetical protein